MLVYESGLRGAQGQSGQCDLVVGVGARFYDMLHDMFVYDMFHDMFVH